MHKKNTWKEMSIYRAYYEDLFQEILENGKNFLFEDFRILLGYRKFIESKLVEKFLQERIYLI